MLSIATWFNDDLDLLHVHTAANLTNLLPRTW